jgi:hypothetical protein
LDWEVVAIILLAVVVICVIDYHLSEYRKLYLRARAYTEREERRSTQRRTLTFQ